MKFGLDNLTAIVDWNKVQLDGTTDEIMPLRDLPGKWRAFGWNVLRCDGHDLTGAGCRARRCRRLQGRARP